MDIGNPFLRNLFGSSWGALGTGVFPRKALCKLSAGQSIIQLGAGNPVLEHFNLIEHVYFRFYHTQLPSMLRMYFSFERVWFSAGNQVTRKRVAGASGRLRFPDVTPLIYKALDAYAARTGIN